MPKLVRDGVALAYEEAGSGTPPLLLVHGWLCDRTYLAPQLEHFRRRHRVVAVDLRGHGESDKPGQEYTMAGLADDLAWLCGQLGVEKPVVVGHSMGGVVALQLAARLPKPPAAIVALDSPIALPSALLRHLRSLDEPLKGTRYREEARRFAEGLFLPTDDAGRRARIVEQMSSAPQHVIISASEGLFADPYASAAAAPTIPIPLLVVTSAGSHMSDLGRLRELCPDLVTGQTVGAGHFHQLEVPEQVNAMIERFITIAVANPARGAQTSR
jgi:pimeloyl-ACP methyl ester carboxylesterase